MAIAIPTTFKLTTPTGDITLVLQMIAEDLLLEGNTVSIKISTKPEYLNCAAWLVTLNLNGESLMNEEPFGHLDMAQFMTQYHLRPMIVEDDMDTSAFIRMCFEYTERRFARALKFSISEE